MKDRLEITNHASSITVMRQIYIRIRAYFIKVRNQIIQLTKFHIYTHLLAELMRLLVDLSPSVKCFINFCLCLTASTSSMIRCFASGSSHRSLNKIITNFFTYHNNKHQ